MIPLFRPSVTDAEIEAVTRVLRSGWWAQGAETEQFEAEFADYVRDRSVPSAHLHAAAVNSGTAALELSARALMPEGGTAIVPAFTFASTALAMKHAGLEVVFADIEEDSLCMDFDDVATLLDRCLPSRVLVVPVWYGGTVVPVNVPWRVKVLEDAAHAAGSKGAGLWGNASAWSFHAVKNLACGDGGMVVSADEDIIREVKRLRWVGIDKSTYDRDTKRGYSWNYDIEVDGEKAHMNDIAAALGRVQLQRLEEMNVKRQVLVLRYMSDLKHLSWLKLPSIPISSSAHLFTIQVDPADRDRLIDHLRAREISAGVHYKPLYYYPKVFGVHDRLPATEKVFRRIVTLPLFPDMTEAELAQVVRALWSFTPTRKVL